MAGFGTGVVAAESAGDNSTIVSEDYEETNIDYEETNIDEKNTILVDEGDDVISSGGPVIYNENNTEITDVDTTEITDIDTTYSDNDNTTTTLENSTVEIDNSYESDTNITTYETREVNIDNSKTVSIDIKNNNSVVNNVYFVPTKDSGKATVVVEDLNEEGLTKKPEGVVYKSFNIFIDNENKQDIDIDDAAVDFKVEKSWLVANGLDSSAIVLNMYESGKWIEVPITITSEDSQYIYFKAEVSEYSTFAITSKTVTVDKILKQSESQDNSNSGEQDNSSSEEIDGPTKNVIIKLLELIIELLKGE